MDTNTVVTAGAGLRVVSFNPDVSRSDPSPFARDRRRRKLGITLEVSNRPALSSYSPEVVAPTVPAANPVEMEARRLAERIRGEYERAGDRGNFIVPGWSESDVLYGALAILSNEGLRLGSMSVADEGCWNLWFFAVPPDDVLGEAEAAR